MSYSTDADLLKEFSTAELAKLTGDITGTTVDYDRVNLARFKADTMINSYLIGRVAYVSPLPVSPMMNLVSLELTIVFLFEIAYAKRIMPSTILYRKQNAINILNQFQNGKLNFVNPSGEYEHITPYIANKNESNRSLTTDELDEYDALY